MPLANDSGPELFAQGKHVSIPSQRMTNLPLFKSFIVFSPQTIYFQPIAGISIIILSTVVLLVNANGWFLH